MMEQWHMTVLAARGGYFHLFRSLHVSAMRFSCRLLFTIENLNESKTILATYSPQLSALESGIPRLLEFAKESKVTYALKRGRSVLFYNRTEEENFL
jgi:hypothetical protein